MKIVSVLIMFSLPNVLLSTGKLMSITIKTKRFNGGKGEKTIFSSDFCPFEQLGVDIAVLSQLCAEMC